MLAAVVGTIQAEAEAVEGWLRRVWRWVKRALGWWRKDCCR
jgi:hypothetical protein